MQSSLKGVDSSYHQIIRFPTKDGIVKIKSMHWEYFMEHITREKDPEGEKEKKGRLIGAS